MLGYELIAIYQPDVYLLFISIIELARNDGIEIFIFDKPHVSGC